MATTSSDLQDASNGVSVRRSEELDDGGGPLMVIHSPHSSDLADSLSSKLTGVVTDILKHTERAVEEFLPMTSEINAGAASIAEQISQSRDLALDHKARLDQERERFHEAASRLVAILFDAPDHRIASNEYGGTVDASR